MNFFYKATSPIILSYAITSYKTQGVIISIKIIVKIQNAFAPSLTYVMLSQVTNRMHLHIRDNLTPNEFNLMI